jgi:nucleoside-diphosphate-sugar epimerase
MTAPSESTILVTGASGLVGGHVVAALARRGYRLRCLVRAASRLDFIGGRAAERVLGDVTAPASLEAAVAGVAGIVHCAGLTQAKSEADFLRVNRDGCEALYRACLARNPGVRRIVHVGSLAALGPAAPGRPAEEDDAPHPVSRYGASKLAGHRVAESYRGRLPIAILIPPAVYGPADRAFRPYFAMARRGFAPLIGRAERWISLVHAGDLADAAVLCLEQERAAGRDYLVDDGCVRTWEEVALAIGRAVGTTPRLLRVPEAAAAAACAVAGAAAASAGRSTFFNRDKFREMQQRAWTCSSARIRAELGFVPRRSLDVGLAETARWYREHRWL